MPRAAATRAAICQELIDASFSWAMPGPAARKDACSLGSAFE